MSADFSDLDLCETNFTVPSPVKKRSKLLPDPKKRKELLKQRELFKSKLKETDQEFFSFLGKKIKSEPEEGGTSLSTPEDIHFVPRGRQFFIQVTDVPTPSECFTEHSMFYNKTTEEFLSFVKNGFLLAKRKHSDEETTQLQSFCLGLLNIEEDELTVSLILNFLSAYCINYDVVLLKRRYSSNFGKLLQALASSVKCYSPVDARELFRETILSSLDLKTSNQFGYSSVLSSCLQVLSSEFQANNEVEWIINLKLEPEELSYLLDILPQNGSFLDVGMLFATRALEMIIQTSKKSNKVTLEEIIILIEGLKTRYQRGKGFNYFVLNEAISRILTSMHQRVPLHLRKTAVEIPYRVKLRSNFNVSDR